MPTGSSSPGIVLFPIAQTGVLAKPRKGLPESGRETLEPDLGPVVVRGLELLKTFMNSLLVQWQHSERVKGIHGLAKVALVS